MKSPHKSLGQPAVAVALVGILWSRTAASRAWVFDHQLGAEGQSFVVTEVAGTGRTIGHSWAATRAGIVSFTRADGVVKLISGPSGSSGEIREPHCATCDGSYIWVVDGYDGTLKRYSDVAGYMSAVRVPAGEPTKAPLIRTMIRQGGAHLLACYDFATRRVTLKRVNEEARVLAEYTAGADSPGNWDWVFALAPYGERFLVYAYQGNGKNGKSWVERRSKDGALEQVHLLRPEVETGPLWFASRSLLTVPAQGYYFALSPKPDGTGVSLVKISGDGQVLEERTDLPAVVEEPYLRLEYFDRQPCVWGAWPEQDVPGHVYLLGDSTSFVEVLGQTPGPVGKLYHPEGVAPLSGGRVAISDTGNYRCVVLSAAGSQLMSSALPGRPGPLVALEDGRLVVVNLDQLSDPSHGGLFVLAATGELLGEWGRWGVGSGELAGPSDLALGEDGNIYVADALNNRVQVFTPAGAPLRQWGRVNGVPPVFRPHAIAVGNGLVFVAQEEVAGRHRILCFDEQGRFIRQWTPSERVTALEASGDGEVLAATETGRLLVFNELGQPLEVAEAPEKAGSLVFPCDLRITDDTLYVADTGNSRVAVFRPSVAQVSVRDFGPTLLPARAGVKVTLTGIGLPRDLFAQLVGLQSSVNAQTEWLDPGLARLQFDLRGASPGQYTLTVSGTRLPQTTMGTVTISKRMDIKLAGSWKLASIRGALNSQPANPVVLTIGLDGAVRWQRLDGTQQEKAGHLTAEGTNATICYTSGTPDTALETEAYTYRFVGKELWVTGRPPATPPYVWVYEPLATASLIEPAVSGCWKLVGVREREKSQSVTWEEYLRITSTGAYVQESNRTGQWVGEMGRMEAHDGRFIQVQQSWEGDEENGWRNGNYVLGAQTLELQAEAPQALTTSWKRYREAGARPLLWLRIGLDGPLWLGKSRQAMIYVGNSGELTAKNVAVGMSVPWVQGGAEVSVAVLASVEPGETVEVPVALKPPATYPESSAQVKVTACASSPEAEQAHCSASLPVARQGLDMALAVSCRGVEMPGGAVPLDITVYSRGRDPATVIGPQWQEEPAVIMQVPSFVSVTGFPGTYDNEKRMWWIAWKELTNVTATNPAKFSAWVGIAPSAPVGKTLNSLVRLQFPDAVAELTPADNFSGWAITVVEQCPLVSLAVQPPFDVRPGKLVTCCLSIRNIFQERLVHEASVVKVDPALDLAAAVPGRYASVDLAGQKVVFTWPVSIDPGRTIQLSQVVRVSPTTPANAVLSFHATSLLGDQGVVTSDVVSVRSGVRVGDLNSDGIVNGADLARFIQGWRKMLQGVIDPVCDIAPLTGVWPEPISMPDGRVDHEDAQAMVEALLFALGQGN